jgi:hypothetical protein
MATVAKAEGSLRDRVVSLPYPAAHRALVDLSEAGWIYGEM